MLFPVYTQRVGISFYYKRVPVILVEQEPYFRYVLAMIPRLLHHELSMVVNYLVVFQRIDFLNAIFNAIFMDVE